MNEDLFAALIPARGGSKGLKKKNLYILNKKPLISWTIKAAVKSKHIKNIFVSSDDELILEIAAKEGINFITRPSILAEDSSSMEEVIIHAIKQIEKKGIKFKYLVLLQPTSPLRDYKNIEEACNKFLELGADSLISVTSTDNKVLKTLIMNSKGYLKSAFDTKFPSMNRQELPPAYKPNGAIYIVDKKLFIENPTFFQHHTAMYEMEKNKSIDIDSVEDINIIEKLNLI
jgi:CMP-N-acetylneuraminic acid synthetase